MAKKQQKSFFERLAEINDKHDNNLTKKTTNKKKRSLWTFILAGALTAGVAVSIAVPLALNVAKVNYIQPSADSKVVLRYNDRNKTTDAENIGSLNNLFSSNAEKVETNLDAAYKKLVFFWYEEEQKASVTYQFRYNASLNAGDTQKTNIALKTLEEIRKEQKDKLADQKANLQKLYLSGWEEKYNQLLLSDNYGKSKTEDEAIEYATYKIVEKEATRRFRIKVQKQSINMLKRASKEYKQISEGGIAATDENGKSIVIGQNELIFPYLRSIEDEQALKDSDFQGMYYYEIPGTDQIVTISTESFIPSHMSPNSLINDYLATNNLGVTTKLTLPGVFKNGVDPQFNFEAEDKKVLANILKYSLVTDSERQNPRIQRVADIAFNSQNGIFKEQASDFMSSINNSANMMQVGKYKTYLNLLSKNASELGTEGITSLLDEFASNTAENIALLANEIFDLDQDPNSLPTIDFSELFVLPTDIQNQIQLILDQTVNSQNVNFLAQKVAQINALIDNFVKNSSDAVFGEFIQNTFKKQFVINNPDLSKQTSFAYVVKNLGGFVVLNDGKIEWVRRTNLNENTILAFLKNYIKQTRLDEVKDLNFLSSINSLQTKNTILAKALKNDAFIAKLKTNSEYTDEKVQELKTQNNSIVQGNSNEKIINSLLGIHTWVEAQKSLTKSYNVHINNASVVISYRNANGEIVEKNNKAKTTITNIFKQKIKETAKGGN
ncbi:HinT-interacting membrane complex protein P80 [Mycoplasmopsis glycophila]|uniref:Membrane protein P80 n=1 Tax=Mycoplasmopsis glycophila TaxID=171285 RepID=A0A449AU98_9BACT|nr:hypothetical protein [Mycoplasmopsis glycophila]VEU70065.1 Uncharacterised protein [Mycoplasmopsis glycophila]